jgi:hypothetical protein
MLFQTNNIWRTVMADRAGLRRIGVAFSGIVALVILLAAVTLTNAPQPERAAQLTAAPG